MSSLVSVSVLNYKQRKYVPECLEALKQQTYPNLEIIFTDNGSLDGSVDFVRTRYPDVRVIAHPSNLYFCKAHNQAIKESNGDHILSLNTDVRVTEDFIENMVDAMELDEQVGMVSGKLLRMDETFQPFEPSMIDSTGIYFTPQMRHFDRGSEEPDLNQYDQMEYVFGPSGAAALYRRSMLEDIAFEGEYFDEDFVIYREDAELAWRAQLLGWRGLYNPNAIAFHIRRVQPGRSRQENPPELNMHSVKNRFLMRIKNQTLGHAVKFLFPMLWRDLQVVGYTLAVERSSLPGLAQTLRLWPRMLTKRRHIMNRKQVKDGDFSRWFSCKPMSIPYNRTN